MIQSVLNNIKATRVSNAVAAGDTDVNCSILDMQGFLGVSFEAFFGALTATAVTGIKVQQGDQSNLSDAADLEGSALAIADDEDNQVLITDIFRPLKRYVRLVITRGTADAVIDAAVGHQYRPIKPPVTQDSTTIAASELLASPDEGTA